MRWKNTPAARVGVLVGVEDVGAVAVEQLRQRRDDAPLIRARDEQRRGGALGRAAPNGARMSSAAARKEGPESGPEGPFAATATALSGRWRWGPDASPITPR